VGIVLGRDWDVVRFTQQIKTFEWRTPSMRLKPQRSSNCVCQKQVIMTQAVPSCTLWLNRSHSSKSSGLFPACFHPGIWDPKLRTWAVVHIEMRWRLEPAQSKQSRNQNDPRVHSWSIGCVGNWGTVYGIITPKWKCYRGWGWGWLSWWTSGFTWI